MTSKIFGLDLKTIMELFLVYYISQPKETGIPSSLLHASV